MTMTSRTIRRAASSLALTALALPGVAQAKDQPITMTYYLPKAKIAAAVSQRLVACPARGDGAIEVETQWALKAKAVPDYANPITVDASSGFLAKRSVDMAFNTDGTLSALNAASEGQGAAVVSSVIKLAGTLAPMLAGVPANPFAFKMQNWAQAEYAAIAPGKYAAERCNPQVLKLLKKRSEIATLIATVEKTIATGQSGKAQEELLERLNTQLAIVDEDLTLTGEAPDAFADSLSGLKPCAIGVTCSPKGSALIAPLAYDKWFLDTKDSSIAFPGFQNGFLVEWAASKAAAIAVSGTGAQAPSPAARRQMIYRRPVPAMLAGAACATPVAGGTCTADETTEGSAAADQIEFVVPQLSPYFSLPVGSGGIFGNSEVSGKFDDWGRPTELSFGSDSGAGNIAGVIDTAGETATKIDGARLDAVNSRIDMLEARKKLDELRNPPADTANDDGT